MSEVRDVEHVKSGSPLKTERVSDERLRELIATHGVYVLPDRKRQQEHKDVEKCLDELQELRLQLTAYASRITELEAESHKNYCRAVAMFYSGRVDDLTGLDCAKAAEAIDAMIAKGKT